MLAHLTDADLAGQWLLAAVAAASAVLAFVAGRRSTRRWPVHADDRRAEATPGG